MKNLSLNLHKKWFDMIFSGEKKEEYREITPYWCNRLLKSNWKGWFNKDIAKLYFENYDALETLLDLIKSNIILFKKYKSVMFSNGMKPVNILPRFKAEIKSIQIGEGKEEWGAKKGKQYFVIKLGKIFDKNNCN